MDNNNPTSPPSRPRNASVNPPLLSRGTSTPDIGNHRGGAAPSSTGSNSSYSSYAMELPLLSHKQRCKVLNLMVPKNTYMILTISNKVGSTENSKQFRVEYRTKIREIVKRLKSEKGWFRSSEEEAAMDETLQGSSYGLFIAADKEGWVPGDEVKLEEDYFFYMYDLAPVQTLLWKEIPNGMRYDSYVFSRVVYSLGEQSVSISIKLRKKLLIKDIMKILLERAPSIPASAGDLYGLYMHVGSTINEDEIKLVLLDPDRSLESYKISSMDILEFKPVPVYEFAFICTQPRDDHPQIISITEHTKVKGLIDLLKGYVSPQTPSQELGLVYISTKNHSDMTDVKFMDENKPIGEFNLERNELIEFKKKTVEKGRMTSTLTVHSTFPVTKLIVKSGPTLPSVKVNLPVLVHQTKKESAAVEPGETILLEIEHVAMYNSYLFDKALWGTLAISNFQLIFIPKDQHDPVYKPYFKIPAAAIHKVDKAGGKDTMEIICKDLRIMGFEFLSGRDPRNQVEKLLDRIGFFGHPTKSFAYQYKSDAKENGWNVYSVQEEYNRIFQGTIKPMWKITNLNQDFKICDTYPQQLIVPVFVTDDVLKGVANFRSKGRIPSLSWINPTNAASLSRCSQPLVSFKRNRSAEDEQLFNTIREIGVADKYLYIYDARPKANAVANVAVGGGFENTALYTNTVLEFLNIANIHAMRDSLNKIHSLAQGVSTNWFAELAASQWLDYIKLIIEGGSKIAETLHSGSSVVIHCSDGWDRTAQLSAIAQILLDPFFRTIKGFAVLVEKEWLSYGHKFNERVGHGRFAEDDQQRSPIFVQFIDSVYQLIQQFPCFFEYNEQFLLTILDNLYSCKYGTFLYNTEKERIDYSAKTKTTSLWTLILNDIEHYQNPFYLPSPSHEPLRPAMNLDDLVLWKNYYFRYYRRKPPTISVEERGKQLSTLSERVKNLESEKQQLEKQLQELKFKLARSTNEDPLTKQ